MYTIYSIYNKKHNKIYIGQTEDIDNRLKEHNDPDNLRHAFTKKFDGNWKLIYKEEVTTRKLSLIREKQLKSYQGRLFIKKLIK
jgi:putative endonuclease